NNNPHILTQTGRIEAFNEAEIDLSALTTINGPSTDFLRVSSQGGGVVSLDGLITALGIIEFEYFAPQPTTFELPNLISVNGADYDLGTGVTLSVPLLQ